LAAAGQQDTSGARSRRGHLAAAVTAILAVLGHEAFLSPRPTDEFAVLAVAVLALVLVHSRKRYPGPARPTAPARPLRRACLLERAACVTLGRAGRLLLGSVLALAVYGFGSGLVPARPTLATGGAETATVLVTRPCRPCVLVAAPANPLVLATVVAIREDLALVLSADGSEWAGAATWVAGPAGPTGAADPPGELVHLDGIDPTDLSAVALETAGRWLRSELLGHLVTVRPVTGHDEGSAGDPCRVVAYRGLVGPTLPPLEQSLNGELAALLAALGAPVADTGKTSGCPGTR